MTRLTSALLAILLLTTACASTGDADSTDGADDGGGDISITTDPFSFVPTVGNSAAYFTVRNDSELDDVLLSASTDQFGTVELHDVVMEDGSARMVEQTDGIPIPAGGEVVLEPGGLHVMLLEAADELAAGDEITIALTFEHAGEMTITSVVRERGEGDPPAMGGMGADDMDDDS